MLVVSSIIAFLVAMLLTAVTASRRAGLKLKCISQMQRVAFDFRMFADDFIVEWRGDSDPLGPGQFVIEDFKDKIYKIDEFWVGEPLAQVQMDRSKEPMMCPAGPSLLSRKWQATPAGWRLFPRENISLALNRRLWRDGLTPGVTRVTTKILDHPDVPLVLDVDGEAAVAAGRSPLYIAPPVDRPDAYANGDFWYPSFRHSGGLNVAFVGGHVASSKQPLDESGWRWEYYPAR